MRISPFDAAARVPLALRERAVVCVIVSYLLIWTLYAVISHVPQQLHADMLEAAALSRDPSWGYSKHPPLWIWTVGLWFAVFPSEPWAFYLLALVIPTVALLITWQLSAQWLTPRKRVLGLALLTLIPFYNFHAQRYNANTILLPLWGVTTLWFVRSYQTRSILYSVLAGVGAAGAMLGKYWSIFLLAGLAVASLVGSNRKAYFRSAAPWITVASGALFLAPHVYWLVLHDFAPFRYATALHTEPAIPWWTTFRYCTDVIAFAIAPIAFVMLALRPRLAALADTLFPSGSERRLAAVAFWCGLLLPVPVALATRSSVTGLWAFPAYALLPVVLLSSPLVSVPRRVLRAGVTVAVAFPLLALLASPVVAWIAARQRPDPVDYRILAAAVEELWSKSSRQPLRIVAGEAQLAYGTAFFIHDKPSAFPDFSFENASWITPTRIAREGIMVICRVEDAVCISQANSLAPAVDGGRTTVQVPGGSFVKRIPGNAFRIIVVPPT
jgi:hypothetical protein